jgi:hypothetical protein
MIELRAAGELAALSHFAGRTMTTLGEMKATIAAEIMRVDLDDAISKEITKAINFYRSSRFWFNEKLDTVAFDTVIGQSQYTASDQSYIPNLIRMDSMIVTRNGSVTVIEPISELSMKRLIGGINPLADTPSYYSYYGQSLTIYPIPNGVYPIVIAGVIRVAAPADDVETDNVWMNEAEELIRSRAKRNIFLHWMEDSEAAQRMQTAETEALDELRRETSSRTQVSEFMATEF